MNLARELVDRAIADGVLAETERETWVLAIEEVAPVALRRLEALRQDGSSKKVAALVVANSDSRRAGVTERVLGEHRAAVDLDREMLEAEFLDATGATRHYDSPTSAEAEAAFGAKVDAAIRSGRILVRDREAWMRLWRADPSNAEARLKEQPAPAGGVGRAFEAQLRQEADAAAHVVDWTGLDPEEVL